MAHPETAHEDDDHVRGKLALRGLLIPEQDDDRRSQLGGLRSGRSFIRRFAAFGLDTGFAGLFLGLMVLFYGRRSFWVLASVVGFVLGLWLASGFSANLPAWAQPVLALALGMAGAAVGFFAPRPAAAIIGGIVLALLGVALAHSYGAVLWLQWLIAIALGFVGFYLFWRLLDWALIVGTSLFGALLAALSLTRLFGFARGLGVLPFLLFLVAGIVCQARDRQMAAELKRLRSKLSPRAGGCYASRAVAASRATCGAATAVR